jgi:ribosomal protein S18 acetylase RimI-like enzyme
MSNEIRIEPAQENDLPSIKLLLVELMEAMTDTEGFDIDRSVENCQALIQSPLQYVFVARQENSIVGFINFSTRKTVMHPASSALIDELIVSERCRGMGIGKLLLRTVVAKCRDLGCCEVEVSTEKSNARARRFYKACGFEEEAILLELDLIDSGASRNPVSPLFSDLCN